MNLAPYLLLSFAFVVNLTASTDRRFFLNSAIAPVSLKDQQHAVGAVTRQTLTAAELDADQRVHFALKLRNFAELRARIAKGEVLSLDEMTARYLPLRETWRKVARWAETQGFIVQPEDPSHMTVAATSSVVQVQNALQMRFARVVGTDAQEYTSAITAPAVPEEFRDCISNVLQLQPHLRPVRAQTLNIAQIAGGYILPQTFSQLYNASGLGVDGKNERIAILGIFHVNPDDLTLFWQTCGLPITIAQFTEVDLPAHPPNNGYQGEEAMDVEWASAMAPGANVVYISTLSLDAVAPWIISEIAAGRPIHQVSTSYAAPEAQSVYPPEMRATLGQYYAAMAAVGVSFFVSSGDDSSQVAPSASTGVYFRGYDPSGVASPDYPASDPSVTGVGGTFVMFQSGAGSVATPPAQEGAWTLSNTLSPYKGEIASGGGISAWFARPDWQTGPGIPAGTMRCVPDVAAVAECSFPCYMQYNGMKFAANGTSLSAPVWAGLCALINQARADHGMSPLGLLGPKIYPLNGTVCFNQMTTGSGGGGDGFYASATNGAYRVGPNYNLVAGLGSPNIGNLILALTGGELPPQVNVAPTIVTPPLSQTVVAGAPVKFFTAASGTPTPTYQWQKDRINISGATSDSYALANASSADAGTYTVVATNSVGTVVSDDAALTVVVPTAIPTFTIQPQSQTVLAGSSVTFTAAAVATQMPFLQWKKNGVNIFGAMSGSYTIVSATGNDSGSYTVVAMNPGGSTTSAVALLTVVVAPGNAVISIMVE